MRVVIAWKIAYDLHSCIYWIVQNTCLFFCLSYKRYKLFKERHDKEKSNEKISKKAVLWNTAVVRKWQKIRHSKLRLITPSTSRLLFSSCFVSYWCDLRMRCIVLAFNYLPGLSKDHWKSLIKTRAFTDVKTTWMCQSGAVGSTFFTYQFSINLHNIKNSHLNCLLSL